MRFAVGALFRAVFADRAPPIAFFGVAVEMVSTRLGLLALEASLEDFGGMLVHFSSSRLQNPLLPLNHAS